MEENKNPLALTFAILTGASAIGDDMESVAFWIKTGVSVILSILSIFFIIYDRVKVAKSKDSDGGERITYEEAIEIAKATAEETKNALERLPNKEDNKEGNNKK